MRGKEREEKERGGKGRIQGENTRGGKGKGCNVGDGKDRVEDKRGNKEKKKAK